MAPVCVSFLHMGHCRSHHHHCQVQWQSGQFPRRDGTTEESPSNQLSHQSAPNYRSIWSTSCGWKTRKCQVTLLHSQSRNSLWATQDDTLIILTEHVRLLHAGPTLVNSSLSQCYHVIGARKSVHSVIRNCIVCCRASAKPDVQMLGQLPAERVIPGMLFENVGVDYAGPVYLKYGHTRKPRIVKS